MPARPMSLSRDSDAAEMNRVAAEEAAQRHSMPWTMHAPTFSSYSRQVRVTTRATTERSNAAAIGSPSCSPAWVSRVRICEAWAIVMRESGSSRDAISVTNDLSLFQITLSRGRPDWFNRELLLTADLNAQVALCCRRAANPGTPGDSTVKATERGPSELLVERRADQWPARPLPPVVQVLPVSARLRDLTDRRSHHQPDASALAS